MSSKRRPLLKKVGTTVGAGGVVGSASNSASASHATPQQYPYADRFLKASGYNYTVADRHYWDIDWITIHLTVGSDGSAIDRFRDPSSDVSAHYVISNYDWTRYPAGSITQMVFHKNIAWHARGGNNTSIGIELEWHPDWGAVGHDCYLACAELVGWLSRNFNIHCGVRSTDDIYDGHNPWCYYDSGIIAHRDCPNCHGCACYDTVPTRCPDPRGFSFDTLVDFMDYHDTC